jgi:hypothetical protein
MVIVDKKTYLYLFIGKREHLSLILYLGPLLGMITSNVINTWLLVQSNKTIRRLQNNESHTTLSIMLIKSVQLTLWMNWVVSAFRTFFFLVRDEYYVLHEQHLAV